MQRANYKFLQGGGEMGALIRNHDWSKSTLGEPDTWPQSLRTTLSIVLNSKFPMFLFWGQNLLCFYNDAYRPSLGNNGKHPKALGIPGEECWPEIWEFIKPLIDQVLSGGEASWNEDQLLPIYRNGAIEDVYWTFSYSPVNDESGKPAGVFVTCSETTEKILNLSKIKESKEELEFAIEAAELATWDLNPKTNKFVGNSRLKDWFGLNPEEEILLPLAISVIAEKDRDRVATAISEALQLLSGGKYDIEYTIINPNTFQERVVRARGKALFNEEGTATRFNGTLEDITDQVIARRKILDAEERARLAIDAAEMGTFDLNLVNEELITSPRFDAIFGLDNSSQHKDYIEKLHPDDIYIRDKAFNKAIITGHLFYVSRVVWHDRSTRWVQSQGEMYYDETGKPVRLLGTAIDITKQKNADDELKRFQFMADNASDIFILMREDGSFAYVNNVALDEWGYNEFESLNLKVSEVDVFYKADTFAKAFIRAQDQNIPQHETLYRRKDGSVYPVEINMVSLMLAEKTYLFAIARDITERKKAREEVLRINQRLEIALEAGKLGSYEHHLDTGKLVCNPQFKANYGLDDGAITNFDELMAMVIPEQRDQVKQKINAAIENHSVYSTEYKVAWPDGSIHWINASGKVSYDEYDKATLMVGVTFDITEQKLLQQQKDEFIGIASHELKTPVTSIKAYTQVLERMLIKRGDNREAGMISKMDAQLNRLTSLIADLLDVTKINSGRLQFNYTRFDFNLLIAEVVEDLQRTTQKHKLVENMQQTGHVHADRERISQVLVNLISNAIKYSPHSQDIIIDTRLNNNEVIVSVQDFGIGISKEKQQMVFEQFYRVSGAKQHTFPGLGLGLYISSEIIKREGGRIWVDSEEGKGAKFYFSLPIQKPVDFIS